MKKFTKAGFITICLFFISIALILNSPVLFEVEKKIIFKPEKNIYPLAEELNSRSEMKFFNSLDGFRLAYLHVNENNSLLPKILFCHGNAKNITGPKIQKKLIFLAKNGYEIFALDYRGYGLSEGSPEEKGIYKDVSDFVAHIKSKYTVMPKDTIIWGHSLGSAVAINEAMNSDFKAVITEGGFTSIEDMRNFRIKNDDKGNAVLNFIRDFIYKSLKINQKFDSREKIKNIKSPMLIIHAKKDKVIPYQMSLELSKLKPGAELFLSETGLHNTSGWQDKTILNYIDNL